MPRAQRKRIGHIGDALVEHRLYGDDGGQAVLLGSEHQGQRNKRIDRKSVV